MVPVPVWPKGSYRGERFQRLGGWPTIRLKAVVEVPGG
jgi:hypothetical protein